MPIWVRSKLPNYQRSPRSPDPIKKHLILKKLQKILDRGYVVAPKNKTFIRSLMDCFEVEKDSDIYLPGLQRHQLWAERCDLVPKLLVTNAGHGSNILGIRLLHRGYRPGGDVSQFPFAHLNATIFGSQFLSL
jgi:hypothetical protein